MSFVQGTPGSDASASDYALVGLPGATTAHRTLLVKVNILFWDIYCFML